MKRNKELLRFGDQNFNSYVNINKSALHNWYGNMNASALNVFKVRKTAKRYKNI